MIAKKLWHSLNNRIINKETYFWIVKASGYNIQKCLYKISDLKAEKYLN